jgi:hypothetical protein
MTADVDTIISNLTTNWSLVTYPDVYFNHDNVILGSLEQAATNGVKTEIFSISFECSNVAAQEYALGLFRALPFKSVRARMVSSWPNGDLFYNRFEVTIQT